MPLELQISDKLVSYQYSFIATSYNWQNKEFMTLAKGVTMMITATKIYRHTLGAFFPSFYHTFLNIYLVLYNTSVEYMSSLIDTRTFNLLKIRLKKNNFLIIQDKTKLIHVFYNLRATDLQIFIDFSSTMQTSKKKEIN